MKIIKFLLPVSFLFLLAGCFEMNEQVDIKENGSGQLLVNMDMSQLLQMMQNYLGKDEVTKQMPKKMVDTTVFFKNIVDTAKDIPADKKALVRNGQVHMKLNMDEKLFKAEMKFPFDNLKNLQQLYTSMNDGTLGTSRLFKGLSPGNDSSANPQGPDMNQFSSMYVFQSKDGLISKKLDEEKWKTLQNSPQFTQMKSVTNMGIEIPYTLTVHLPRPVQKVDNLLAKLSDDKKTVTIKYNLAEVFEHPEKFEYTIAY